MKKKMIFTVVLSMLILGFLSTSTVHAVETWYTCTVNLAGTGAGYIVVNLTDDGNAFIGKSFYLSSPDATTGNRFMATALTAMSAGKKVMVYVDPLVGVYPIISNVYVIN